MFQMTGYFTGLNQPVEFTQAEEQLAWAQILQAGPKTTLEHEALEDEAQLAVPIRYHGKEVFYTKDFPRKATTIPKALCITQALNHPQTEPQRIRN